jgi:hypothetical protein
LIEWSDSGDAAFVTVPSAANSIFTASEWISPPVDAAKVDTTAAGSGLVFSA